MQCLEKMRMWGILKTSRQVIFVKQPCVVKLPWEWDITKTMPYRENLCIYLLMLKSSEF